MASKVYLAEVCDIRNNDIRFMHSGRRGQTLLMFTVTLAVTCTVVGLSVDLGWAYYVKMRLRTAAEAAALSAATYSKNHNDSCSTIACGVAYTCAGVTPPTTALQAGCLY